MAVVYVPLPDRDFDTTEVAVPWAVLTAAGHTVLFATEDGATPACDPLLITGVLFGQLGAAPDALAEYERLSHAPSFVNPARWRDVVPGEVDALLLAGGHAPGMRQYLGSALVQQQTAALFERRVPVAAICHGVLVAARARAASGRSCLHGRRTTCLPKYMERTAWLATAWLRGDYYRTYPTWVEDEVRAALADHAHFERGPFELLRRGTRTDDGPTFLVEDGELVSGRWPGDAWALGRALVARLDRSIR